MGIFWKQTRKTVNRRKQMDCQSKKYEDDLNFDQNSEKNKFLFFIFFGSPE